MNFYKKVCLINPPYNSGGENECNTEHIGIEYIAASLEKNGYKVDIYDCPFQKISFEKLCDILRDRKYDVIGISTYFYNALFQKRIVRFLKNINPSSIIFLGGYLPTLSYEKIVKELDYVDCMIIGEGEETCIQLMNNIENKKLWGNIKGLVYKSNNSIINTGRRNVVCNLDDLPFPKRLEYEYKTINVITSRGCYGHCNFCGITEFYEKCEGRKIRRRSARNVVSEIQELKRKIPTLESINFNDDNFALSSEQDKKWFDEFFSEIVHCNINLNYSVLLRANDICRSVTQLKKYKLIGLNNIFIGIESFVDRHLEFYNKKVTKKENIRALEICDELNIRYMIGFMMFNPITTIEELLSNVYYFKKIKFNNKHKYFMAPVASSIVIAIENSPLYDFIEQKGLVNKKKGCGYDFENKEVQLCYDFIVEWHKKIVDIEELFYLEKDAELLNRTLLLKQIRIEFYNLFFTDLKVLEKICYFVLKGSNEDMNLLQEEKEVMQIRKNLIKIKQCMEERNDLF